MLLEKPHILTGSHVSAGLNQRVLHWAGSAGTRFLHDKVTFKAPFAPNESTRPQTLLNTSRGAAAIFSSLARLLYRLTVPRSQVTHNQISGLLRYQVTAMRFTGDGVDLRGDQRVPQVPVR